MKATTQLLPTSASANADKSRLSVWAELVKARLTFLVLLTTSVGFYMGSRGPVSFGRMLHLLAGTALLAAGAAALNQLLEREYDAKMRRTQNRPLPSGRISPETALVFGSVCAVVGIVHLAVWVNLLVGMLGFGTLALYLFVYTPLKRHSWLNTWVGAVSGALPPLMGWVGARNELTLEGLSLFAIQFLWQIPHFLAIAWLYRDEYCQAGFRMLPVVDAAGRLTGAQAVGCALALGMMSLAPAFLGLAGLVYFWGAALLGLGFISVAVQFARHLTRAWSRQLFWMSLLYLPVLFGLLVADKLKL